MDTRIETALHSGWRGTCAVGIVAVTLLASCAPELDPNETHVQASVSTAHPRASGLYVDINDGMVTVSAHDAPLQAVIEKLAHQSGLRLVTQDRLDQRVTVELSSLALTAALQELLRGHSFILVGARQTTHAREDDRGMLWILSKELNESDANGSVGSPEASPESARREETNRLDALSAALADHDSNARLDAVSELGDHFKDEQAAILLASVAAYDEHPSVRAEALHAIAGGRPDIHSSVFTQALKDLDAGVRKAAISALEDVGGESSLQILAIALRDGDASVRTTAVDAIGEIGGSDALRLLESALGDPSPAVREAAIDQLGRTRSSRVERDT